MSTIKQLRDANAKTLRDANAKRQREWREQRAAEGNPVKRKWCKKPNKPYVRVEEDLRRREAETYADWTDRRLAGQFRRYGPVKSPRVFAEALAELKEQRRLRPGGPQERDALKKVRIYREIMEEKYGQS
jgi:hypothetical protein